MFRFFGLVWNASDPHQRAVADALANRILRVDQYWKLSFDAAGLRAIVSRGHADAADVIHLRQDSGIVLGTLFQSARSASAVHSIGADETTRIVSSAGRRLVEDYWGSYVALIRDPSGRQQWVLRAPRTPLTCFSALYEGVHIYFSRTEDLAALDIVPLSIDWTRVAMCVVCGSGGARGPALQELSEVRPGECIEHDVNAVHKRLYWNPVSISQSNIIEDVDAAAGAIRETVQTSTYALASRHDCIVHKLSGGLDSSIVACCLKDAPRRPTIICINDYSTGPDSDERIFARLAANRAGSELLERPRAADLRLDACLSSVRTAAPSPQFLELAHDRPAVNLACERKATAVSTGVQGDATFHMHPAELAAADFAGRHGLNSSFFRVSLDAARLARTSIWPVIGTALRYSFLGVKLDYWDIQRQCLQMNPGKNIVNAELLYELASNQDLADPWFRSLSDGPPGKLWQIFQMTSASAYEDSFSRPTDPEFIHPLMAQPVAEVCLRIPTYTHLANGWDRAVARLAFAENLPPQIRERRTKGGLEEYAKDVLKRNIAFARQLLLDGALVKERILNRSILDRALSSEPTRSSVTTAMLLIYLGVEVWIHTWKSGSCRPAA